MVQRWSRLKRARKGAFQEKPTPSRNDEYLLYQTLLGTFPAEALDDAGLDAYRERIQRYMVKAAREAKAYTSWISVNAEYEDALTTFVATLLDASPTNAFLADLRANYLVFAWFGALNSLSTSLLHFTAPGVPDLYQGDELIELNLVDPDNRRPVDYVRRREALHCLQQLAALPSAALPAQVQALLATPYDGRAKLWTIYRALELRQQHPEIFAQGDYAPINVAGTRGRHVIAYARRYGKRGVIAVAGRMFASLGLDPGELPIGEQAWGDTALELPLITPGTRLNNVLTGEQFTCVETRLPLARVFAHFPGALLAYERSE